MLAPSILAARGSYSNEADLVAVTSDLESSNSNGKGAIEIITYCTQEENGWGVYRCDNNGD